MTPPITGDVLSQRTRELLAPYFPELDLGAIRLRGGVPSVVRRFAAIEPAAVTFGSTICVAPGACDAGSHAGLAQIAHELCHVEQWRRHGWLGFLTRYLGDYWRNRRRGMAPAAAYGAIPFERQARRRERQIIGDLWRRFPSGANDVSDHVRRRRRGDPGRSELIG